jgi:hypothetical protein
MKMAFSLRYLGIILMVLAVALFLIMYNFSTTMLNMIDQGQIMATCGSYQTCPHIAVLNQAFIGYILAIIIFIIGLLIVFLGGGGKKEEAIEHHHVEEAKTTPPEQGKKDKWAEHLKQLTGDEKKVYETVVEAEGVMFQGELVEKSGFPKAKVSRILDRMEARGLIERKRRGMSNAVVLK